MTAAVAEIVDHVAQAQARLLQQLQGRPIMAGIIAALGAAVQLCEGQLYALLTGRNFYGMNAQGAQLDAIGAIVGIARNGLSDAEYYVEISGQIAANGSQADNSTLVAIAQTVFQASDAAVISAYSPGHAHVRAPASIGVEVGSAAIPAAIMAVAKLVFARAVAAGVAIDWFVGFESDGAFTLAANNAGLGLGDANVPGSGGALASFI